MVERPLKKKRSTLYEVDEENTACWEVTPEEQARHQADVNAYWAQEEAHLKRTIGRPPRSHSSCNGVPPSTTARSSEVLQKEQHPREEACVQAKSIARGIELKEKKMKMKRVLIIGAILLAVTIAVGVGIDVTSSSKSAPAPTPTPTPAPTTPATKTATTDIPTTPTTPTTTTPTTTRTTSPTTPLQRESIISLIQSRSASTSFSDSSSPQSQSLDWILSDPFSLDGLSDDRFVQRFALATLWYSTNGTTWDHDGWVESKNECDWGSDGFVCSQDSVVEELDLSDDNLSGSVPIELGLLTQLRQLVLRSNLLSGSIPSELALLTQLTKLNLSFNELAGSLPSELGLLSQLRQLFLRSNLLTGSLPSELGLLTQFTTLNLAQNQLTGSLPPSLCSTVDVIAIDCNEISCQCCIASDYTSC